MTDAGVRALKIFPEVQHGHVFLIEMRHHPRQKVHFDLLTLAGALAVEERRQDPVDHVHRADLIGQPGAGGDRRAVAGTGSRREPRETLDQHVLSRTVHIWARLAVARAGAVDDRGVGLAEVIIAVAETVEDAGAEVLDHDVGGLGHAHDDLADLWRFEVERDRSLVAVPREEVRAFAVADPLGEERHRAEHVAGPHTLDLDDVRAHVGQKLGREGTLQQMAEIQDRHAFECLVHFIQLLVSVRRDRGRSAA